MSAAAPDAGLPQVELLRVDPRLEDVAASLFWAAFPHRRLGKAAADRDGRVPFLVDAALDAREDERWRAALDALLRERATAGAFVREVRDRDGRREELALPVAPEAYAGGAWLVGPFPTEAAADAWAARVLQRPWVHDVVVHVGAPHADVFRGDPDAAAR
ncbi:MAG: hypothetical protein ABR510_02775 [Trueperaceae bacterium]